MKNIAYQARVPQRFPQTHKEHLTHTPANYHRQSSEKVCAAYPIPGSLHCSAPCELNLLNVE